MAYFESSNEIEVVLCGLALNLHKSSPNISHLSRLPFHLSVKLYLCLCSVCKETKCASDLHDQMERSKGKQVKLTKEMFKGIITM